MESVGNQLVSEKSSGVQILIFHILRSVKLIGLKWSGTCTSLIISHDGLDQCCQA